MAKVLGPLHSSEARGAIGSLIYNSWRGQATVKTRSGPGVYNTQAQLDLRALTAQAVAGWQAIDPADRAAWDAYADSHLESSWTGQTKRISGYNWYVRINVRRLVLAGAIEDTPPAYVLQGDIKDLVVSAGPTTIGLDWDFFGIPDSQNAYIQVYWTGVHSPGERPTVKHAHQIATFLIEDYSDTISQIATGWYTVYVRVAHNSGMVGQWHKRVVDNS